MSLNDKDIADKLKEFFSGSTVTRTGGKNYANSEEIPLGGGGSDREQIIKNRKQKPSKQKGNGKIKYAYTTIGSSANKTALYVAGFQNKKSIKVDEVDNQVVDGDPTRLIDFVCLDNLGGSDFIVSYLISDSYNSTHTFKCAKRIGATFSITVSTASLIVADGVSVDYAGVGNPTDGQFGYFLGSVGFGNWVSNRLAILASSTSASGNTATSISTSETRLISDISVNPKVQQVMTSRPYTVTSIVVSNSSESSTTKSSTSYQAYISPTVTVPTAYTGYGLDPTVGFFTNFGRFYHPVRYNSQLDKGVFGYAEYDAGYQGMGICRGATINKIPYLDMNDNIQSNPSTAATVAVVSLVSGSNVATKLSGVTPPVGAALGGSGIPDGTLVVQVNGNSIKLSREATSNRASTDIFWGFPVTQGGAIKATKSTFGNSMTFTGTRVQCDLQSNGMTVIYRNDIAYQNTILNQSIQTPVSFFRDDFTYRKTVKETVYPPGIVKKNESGVATFSILAASYNPV